MRASAATPGGMSPRRIRAGRETSTERGAFILAKLRAHDAGKLEDVLGDVYRADRPDPADMTKVSGRWSCGSWVRPPTRSRTCSSGWRGCGDD